MLEPVAKSTINFWDLWQYIFCICWPDALLSPKQ